MARLSKHGEELYRFDTLTARIAIMSDGEIMRDYGSGWKLWKRIKAGVNPREYADRQRVRHKELDAKYPAFAAYRDMLHSLVSFKARSRVNETMKLLAGDPDGVYVELDESGWYGDCRNPELSLDDCVQLMRAMEAAEIEAKLSAPAEVA